MLKLNEEQNKAVLSESKYILVVAGAGSGKTRVLTERISNLLENRNILPREILALTFTNKAANVMKERLALKGLNVSNMWISTFHSMCVRVLRENASKIDGYNSNFTIYDETDRNSVIKKVLEKFEVSSDEYKKELSKCLNIYKNQIITLEEFCEKYSYDFDCDNIVKFIREYEEILKQNNAFDFDDLLIKTYLLLRDNLDVRKHYQNRFKHILIDEFQDTNEIQFKLVELLAGGGNSIFIVGDEDQCIYSWRGANYANISNFVKYYNNVEIIKLEENYRSTKKIIDAANIIIEKNYNRTKKTLYTNNESGVQVEYKKCEDEYYEANYVVQNIYNLIHFQNYKYSDIAILVRLNSLTRNLEEKLLNYGINYRIYGGTKFYDRLEIKNFLAYLKVLNNPTDDISFARIINWPKRSIGEATVEKLKEIDYSKSLFQNLLSLDENSNLSRPVLIKLLSLKNIFLNIIENMNKLSLYDLSASLVDILNLNEFLNKQEEDKNRILNIEQLLLSIKEFEKNNENCTLSDYLESVSLISDIDGYNAEDEAVTIATVHASKGLEFKVVFIIGLENTIFPLERCDEEDKEEERRLMYVAVTRCMERLYLTCAKKRFLYGTTRYQQVSEYIKDLGFEQPKQFERKNYSYTDYNDIDYSTKKSTYNNNLSVKDNLNEKINNKPKNTYNSGDKVLHSKFGEGVVISVNGSIIKILFAGVGMKELMLEYSPLTKLQ